MFTEGEEKVAGGPVQEPAPERKYFRIPRPEFDLPAVLEVLGIAAGFILITNLGLFFIAGSLPLRDLFQGTEGGIIGGFLIGALVQLTLVGLLYAFGQKEIKAAISSLKKRAPAAGWQIALAVAAVEIVFIAGGWLEEPARLLEFSKFALIGSLIPAVDGFSQEVVFRGFILLRLRRAGMEGWLPIVISGLGFSLIHIGYASPPFEPGIGAVLAPLLGTFGLGMAWAWTFRMSNYKLAPVLVSHLLVILVLQPWLALSYGG